MSHKGQTTITDADFALFRQAHRIADLLVEHRTALGLRPNDRRADHANGLYAQTESGLFLEMYYSQPSMLWTPWGQWRFISGGGRGGNETQVFLIERFGAVEFVPQHTTTMGVFGPVYALHRIDGEALPPPVACESDREGRVSYEQAMAEWNALVARHTEGA